MAEILTGTQARFLGRFYQNSGEAELIYLSGGTALAAYYLQHRYSDDLDFFSRDPGAFRDINPRVLASAESAGLDIVDVETGDHSVRYTLSGDAEEAHALQKVEFLFDPSPYMGKPERFDGVFVDALLCITVKKVDALNNRTEVKDFVDFFFAVTQNNFRVTDLIAVAKEKNGAVDQWNIATRFDQIDSLVPLGDFERLYMRTTVNQEAMIRFYKDWAHSLFQVSRRR